MILSEVHAPPKGINIGLVTPWRIEFAGEEDEGVHAALSARINLDL